MSLTGLEVFDTTLQKTNEWLQEIAQEFGTENRQQAYVALRATLHTLRERLPIEETAHLGAQLPMLIRGIYYEGWKPTLEVSKMHRDEFLEHVLDQLEQTALADIDPEITVRVVLQILSRKVAPGEVEKLIHVMPADLRDLWPSGENRNTKVQAV
ncbi:MAG TPA: DUF2267 domain-containing protein [Bryobacteraceae bacterium]|jgi:uncharacterized protein (DUF2267 family)|nr:DUF2267 domain-containing protein [Bryobacteraceae bacterium]